MEPNVRLPAPASLVTSAFRLLVRLLNVRRASLMLRAEPAHQELRIVRAIGLPEQVVEETRVPLGRSIAGRVAADAQPLLVQDIAAHPGLAPARRTAYATPSFASAPISIEGEVVGVVNVADKAGNRRLSKLDLTRLVLLASHLAECLRAENEIRKAYELADTDPLTSLLNRRALDTYLAREIERAKRSGSTLCLLMLDLDHFKVLNDRLGHPVGDTVLARIAQVIRQHVRAYDSVFRYGGDEFLALLPQTGPDQAAVLGTRIQEEIARTQLFETGELAGSRLTASAGLACFPEEGETPAALLTRADAALYEAKRARL